MGTGSEPPQIFDLQKNATGSVPVPFFHGTLASARQIANRKTAVETQIVDRP